MTGEQADTLGELLLAMKTVSANGATWMPVQYKEIEAISAAIKLEAESALLRKALERFLETTEGEDAVSGMALHGPITLAKAALARTEAKP